MSMWLSTNKVFDNSLMFFKFQKTNDSCLFNFTNGKKMFSKEVSIASFDELYSVSNNSVILYNKISNYIMCQILVNTAV